MRVLTVKEIQEILQISEKKAKALIRLEDFKAVQIGAEYRVLEDDLYQWIRDHYNQKVKLDYSNL